MINKFTCDFTDILIKHMNDKENNDKIKENIIDPVIMYIFDKFYPYLIISCGVMCLIFVLLFFILALIIRSLN
jgi:uncharacterized membrane protein